MKNKKIIFMGNIDLSAYILKKLVENGYKVALVVVNKLKNNKKSLVVKKQAEDLGIEVKEVDNLNKHRDFFINFGHDLIITCAFGHLISQEILDSSKIGNLNIHTSLLPKYRGAAPLEYAILNRDKKTGVSIIEMVKKMDAGDVYAMKEIDINRKDTKSILLEKLKKPSFLALKEALKRYVNGENPLLIQDESKVSFAPSIKNDEEKIDLNKSGEKIEGKIFALSSTSGAYLLLDEKRFKIYDGEFEKKSHNYKIGEIVKLNKKNFILTLCDGFLKLNKVQIEGKKILDAISFFNGHSFLIGKKLR